MRRPPTSVLLLALLVVGAVGGCTTDDDSPGAEPTSTTIGLGRLTLEATDLPEGFTPSPDVDDTITAFCANEDAAAGLQASAREVRGFTRDPAGASIIQLVFRFGEEGAARFVAQAGEILGRCSGVPDATGLAFEYEPLSEEVDGAIARSADAHVGRYGQSVGSGNLTLDLVVFQRGAVAQLVAVLGLDLPRPQLDALATATFEAVAAHLEPGPPSG
jgi:hypothetical protein